LPSQNQADLLRSVSAKVSPVARLLYPGLVPVVIAEVYFADTDRNVAMSLGELKKSLNAVYLSVNQLWVRMIGLVLKLKNGVKYPATDKNSKPTTTNAMMVLRMALKENLNFMNEFLASARHC